ncbi:MAG: hypothetical protein FWH48_06515, partial [Oscillospiraceae bacterium]|nr:hypothetical protein [Oscillospiraceae bacterium]
MAKYIWHNPCDKSRNPYAAFRKTFWLDDAKNIASADFNIFADTIYKLWVNGTFVGFGPVRFDPRFPQFDTYDLSPYLKNGKNAIAVLANFHGHKTYKNVPEVAAMIAWGKICDIDLSTNAKNWKCEAHAAYLRYTPKLSFALNAQIFYDQAKFDEDWTNPDYDDQAWNDAVELVDQTHFGELAPREIPFMSMEKLPLNTNTKIFPLVINEELYSYSLEPPYKADDGMKPDETYDKTIKWQTYIYSPVAQNIIAGTLWETILVNDLPCGSKVTDEAKPLRENFVMSLNEGWNQVSGSGNIFQDIYDCYLALPKNRGLSVFADKNKNSGHIFKYKKIAPKGEEETWAYTTKKDKAESPCREASWDTYGSCAQSLAPDQLNGFTFEKTLYPDGFSLLFDMEHMTLAFPSFVFSGTKGATIDLTYNDRLTSDGKHIRQESWIPLGDRIVCSNDAIDWSPISPRGFRYLALTFRNTKGDITLKNLDFISAHYPTKKIGSFECSDPALNKIWEMCALTQSINMEDAYDDCVDRERGLYVLDTLVQYHNNLACFGDHKLMKRCLEIYAQSLHPNGQFRCIYPNTGDYVLPDFSLYAIDAFYSYYMYTGDKNLISTWWEAIKTNLGVFDALSDERTDCLLDADPPDPNKPHDKRTRHLG